VKAQQPRESIRRANLDAIAVVIALVAVRFSWGHVPAGTCRTADARTTATSATPRPRCRGQPVLDQELPARGSADAMALPCQRPALRTGCWT